MLLRSQYRFQYEIDEEFTCYVKQDIFNKTYSLYLRTASAGWGGGITIATAKDKDTLYIVAHSITEKYMNKYPYIDINEELFWISKRNWTLKN